MLPEKQAKPRNHTTENTTGKIPEKQEVGGVEKNIPFDTFVADDFDFSEPQEVPTKEGWRIEYKTYTKADGTISIYFNYRARKRKKRRNGKTYIPYKKGGTING